MMIVDPLFLRALSTNASERGSRDAVGSSSNRTSPSKANADDKIILAASPPERDDSGLSKSSSSRFFAAHETSNLNEAFSWRGENFFKTPKL